MAKFKRAGIIKEVFIFYFLFFFIPKIVGQHGGGKKEEWEMVSVCGFHGFKQNLP